MSAALVAVFKKADKIGGQREGLREVWDKLKELPCTSAPGVMRCASMAGQLRVIGKEGWELRVITV